MIRIFLGNVGSGKTACAVREMALDAAHRKTYSNIITQLGNQVTIAPEMILKKIKTGETNKRDGSVEEKFKYEVNVDFWKGVVEKEKAINVIIDEAHSVYNARRSMSAMNIAIGDWLALIRRVLGQTESGYGTLTFITQLPMRIDSIAREMATQIRFHRCHYSKHCKHCGRMWQEHSEMPEPRWTCLCGSSDILKFNHYIEVWHFPNMQSYQDWNSFGMKTFYRHYLVKDIEEYFPVYNTLQWENLLSKV